MQGTILISEMADLRFVLVLSRIVSLQRLHLFAANSVASLSADLGFEKMDFMVDFLLQIL